MFPAIATGLLLALLIFVYGLCRSSADADRTLATFTPADIATRFTGDDVDDELAQILADGGGQ